MIHGRKIGVKKDRPVVHHPPVPNILRIAGKLLSLDRHVISSVDLRIRSKLCKGFHNRFAKRPHIQCFRFPCICYIRIIQISQIVVHRASAGKPPYYLDVVSSDEWLIDLRKGILIFPDDNRTVILPEHKIASVLRQAVKNILFCRQIKRRICCFQIDNRKHILLPARNPRLFLPRKQTGFRYKK